MEADKSPEPQPATHLSAVKLFFYAFPAVAMSLFVLPMNIVIPTFYASNTQATLAGIGMVAGFARFFDAVTDPLVGWLSDLTRSRMGPRKPWLIAGALVSSVSVYFLFQPPPDSGLLYYAVWSSGVFLGFTFFEIPNRAWGMELAHSYYERSRISTYLGFCYAFGSLLFWVMPVAMSPWTGSTAITPIAMIGIAWLFVVMMPATTLASTALVPQGRRYSSRNARLRDVLGSLRINRPMWRYSGAVTLWGIGNGAFSAVLMIIFTDYLGLAAHFPFMMIVFFVVQTATMPVWMKLMIRFGKHRSQAFSWIIDTASRFVVLFLVPGDVSLVLVYGLVIVIASLNGASYIAPMAILGDVIDYDILKTRTNKAASFAAFNNLLVKISGGIGVALALTTLDLFGYRIGVSADTLAWAGLMLCYVGIPGVTYLLAAGLLWNFPLDKRRHAIILRRIESLANREKRANATA